MTQPCDPAATLGDQFLRENPHLQNGLPPAPMEGSSALVGGQRGGSAMVGSQSQAARVIQAGGLLPSLLLHPDITPLEQIYRKLPPEGVFEATTRNPMTFEMGAFTVPRSMAFVLAEYRFDIFRLSGQAGNDAVLLEERRLPTVIGYDMNIEQFRKANLDIEVLPIQPPVSSRQAFKGTTVQGTDYQAPQVSFPTTFDTATQQVLATAYGAAGPGAAPTGTQDWQVNKQGSRVGAAGAGSALLPQSQRMQGPSRFPFSFQLKSGQVVQLQVAAFNPCPVPIAFFEARLSGYLIGKPALDKLIKGCEPCY